MAKAKILIANFFVRELSGNQIVKFPEQAFAQLTNLEAL